MGVVPIADALTRAEAAGLDLVEVSPNADPPVARVIDWGKFQYQQTKQQQKAKKKHKVQDIKQMRFSLKIGSHDMDVKLRKMRGFLEAGDKIKVSVMFKGREITHPELGHDLLNKIVGLLADIAAVDTEASQVGRFISLTIRPK